MRIPHSASDVGDAEARAAKAACEANYVGFGPSSRRLEQTLASRTERAAAFAVLSGSHALELALAALDLPTGSRVAIPVLTCASVLHAVIRAGHTPCLVDIRSEDLTLDLMRLPAQVDAIIAPHAYGAAVDVTALEHLGLPWIEDCATSPGTVAAGRPAGSHGTLAVFSFGATKYVTGGTGGMVLTDDPALAARIAAVLDETPQRASWRNTPAAVQGGRMADVNASIALTQLGRLDAFVARRQAIASCYLHLLGEFAPAAFTEKHSYYRAILRMDGIAAAVAVELQHVGIDARTSVNPWLDQVRGEHADAYPHARDWRDALVSLPIHPRLTDEEVDFVARSVLDAVRLARPSTPR